MAVACAIATGAHGQTVKITPLGSHAGEFCATDRAMLFEDPTGVRLVYDVGASVAGAGDPRLGDVHVILLSHAHGDHIGLNKAAGLNAGVCAKPETVSALPATTTGEIAAAKNAAIMTGIDMTSFVAKKVEAIHGKPVENCAETGLTRDTIVPLQAPCRAGVQLGGKRTFKTAGQAKGVQVTTVFAVHSNNAGRAMLSEGGRSPLVPDELSAYVGHANGYMLVFTNGLRVYLSGDTGIMSEMKTIIGDFYKPNLAIINLGATTMPSEEAAYAVNTLLRPAAVIPSHSSEGATEGGKLKAGSRTADFVRLVKGRKVHLSLSGRTMEFDGKAKCVAGC
ncbi:MAG: MBL fold metallo-hydrolase [Betaproteobacteria bacterium]|nr:MBL fold metallo-hydrolase [Betaproteobacteria bacterium]